MKSILHVALIAPTHSSSGIIKAFQQKFEEYSMFDWQKVKFNSSVEEMRDRLIGKAMMERPDVIFLHIQNKDAMDIETAKELAKISFVVNYTFDVRNDIRWMKDVAPHIGLTLFGDYDSVEECHAAGIKNVDYLASSADYEWYKPLGLPKTQDIVFVGNNFANTSLDFPQAKQRAEMVEFMQKEFGDSFKVYGMNWGPDSKMVNPQEEIAIYNTAKVAITHNNFYRRGYTSDRLYRAIGCGVCTVPQYFPGYKEDFSMPSWTSFGELRHLCANKLEHGVLRDVQADYISKYFINHQSWFTRVQELKSLIQKHDTNKVATV